MRSRTVSVTDRRRWLSAEQFEAAKVEQTRRSCGGHAPRWGGIPIAFAWSAVALASESDEQVYGLATLHQVISCNPTYGQPGGEQIYTCTYTAPDSCRIVSATATRLGGSTAESLAVTVASNGSTVTSTVTVPPNAAARHGFHPQISLTAKLDCPR